MGDQFCVINTIIKMSTNVSRDIVPHQVQICYSGSKAEVDMGWFVVSKNVTLPIASHKVGKAIERFPLPLKKYLYSFKYAN